MSLLIRPCLSGFLQDWKFLPASLVFVELAVNTRDNAIFLVLFLLSVFIVAGKKKKKSHYKLFFHKRQNVNLYRRCFIKVRNWRLQLVWMLCLDVLCLQKQQNTLSAVPVCSSLIKPVDAQTKNKI